MIKRERKIKMLKKIRIQRKIKSMNDDADYKLYLIFI
jgi:hypothetical protein